MSHCIHCCGGGLNNGEGKVFVGLTAVELVDVACSVSSDAVRRRALCALEMIDEELAEDTRSALREAKLLPPAAPIG